MKATTILRVDGMTCPSCIRHVTHALAPLPGVGAVQVELRAGTVRVDHERDATSIAQMIEALRDAGYDARTDP